MRLQNIARQRAGLWQECVVVADETYVVAARASESALPVLSHAHRFAGLEKANPLVVELGDHRRGSRIVPALVHDDLEIAVALREHRFQGMAQSVRPRPGGTVEREHP